MKKYTRIASLMAVAFAVSAVSFGSPTSTPPKEPTITIVNEVAPTIFTHDYQLYVIGHAMIVMAPDAETLATYKEPVKTAPAVAAELFFGDELFNKGELFASDIGIDPASKLIDVKNKGPTNRQYSELGNSIAYMREGSKR